MIYRKTDRVGSTKLRSKSKRWPWRWTATRCFKSSEWN